MRIGGLLKFSLIDYPGKVAAVIFTQGCNYRCPFCHNPELVLPELFMPPVDVREVTAFLQQRRGQIQGVVITGGEPTIQPDLMEFIRTVKSMGFLVKLDTNGMRPDVLEGVFREKLVDYVAMDIKASPEKYAFAAGVAVDIALVKASIALIKSSGVEYLFRTTAVKGFLQPEDLRAIGVLLEKPLRYKLQRGSTQGKLLDATLGSGEHDFSDDEWQVMEKHALICI